MTWLISISNRFSLSIRIFFLFIHFILIPFFLFLFRFDSQALANERHRANCRFTAIHSRRSRWNWCSPKEIKSFSWMARRCSWRSRSTEIKRTSAISYFRWASSWAFTHFFVFFFFFLVRSTRRWEAIVRHDEISFHRRIFHIHAAMNGPSSSSDSPQN